MTDIRPGHGNAVTARGDWMATATGRMVYPLDPRPEDVDIDDIAYSLARQNRFAGHMAPGVWCYSVAQHSLIVSEACLPEHALIGLLHDAAEAYVQDLIRPFKRNVGDVYHNAERAWHVAIGYRFGLGQSLLDLPEDVRRADEACLAAERRDIIDHRDREWNLREAPLTKRIFPVDAHTAYVLFKRRFLELTHEHAERP